MTLVIASFWELGVKVLISTSCCELLVSSTAPWTGEVAKVYDGADDADCVPESTKTNDPDNTRRPHHCGIIHQVIMKSV